MVIWKTDYRFSCVEKKASLWLIWKPCDVWSFHVTYCMRHVKIHDHPHVTMADDKASPQLSKGACDAKAWVGGFGAALLIKTLAQLLEKTALHLAHWASTVKRLSLAVVKLYDFPCCFCLQASDITEDDESSFGSVLCINTAHLSSLKRGKVCWLCIWI